MIIYILCYITGYQWIVTGLKRFKLFGSIGDSLRKSAIFGLGPGMHALNGQWTYHNSYLEILAMSGVVGLFLFLQFIIVLIKECVKNNRLLLLVLPLLVFSIGSFAIRNIEFWLVVSMAYSIISIEKMNRSNYE